MLPDNFKWIDSVGLLPRMITEGIKILGTKEIPGPKSNPVILQFAKELDVDSIYKNDDSPWCAVAHCGVARRSGKVVTFPDKYDFLRALSFAKQAIINPMQWQTIHASDAMFGDSMVFKRPEGGHVGINVGESVTHFYIMGGNQNNMYSFTRVAKERLYAIIRPIYYIAPVSVKKYVLNDTGTPVTSNEQ